MSTSSPESGPGSESEQERPLRVLIVDDSAVVRQGLCAILTSERGFDAAIASDPILAIEKMKRLWPDVVVTDIEMPRMDGLTFLTWIMQEQPTPVVICSEFVGDRSDLALLALERGAVELIAKPRLGVRAFLQENEATLVDSVQAAAKARLRTTSRAETSGGPATVRRKKVLPRSRMCSDLVVVGASTGGTEAIRTITSALAGDCPPLVIVQHMPAGFTRSFAARLDGTSAATVREAADGDVLRPGLVLIAPGDRHISVSRSGSRYEVSVTEGPLVSRHRPSVDVLFRSVADAAGPNAVGILLTGMGNDGADGLKRMRTAGAATIAQDEATCAVFGMPRAAVACNAVQHVLSIDAIAAFAAELSAATERRT